MQQLIAEPSGGAGRAKAAIVPALTPFFPAVSTGVNRTEIRQPEAER